MRDKPASNGSFRAIISPDNVQERTPQLEETNKMNSRETSSFDVSQRFRVRTPRFITLIIVMCMSLILASCGALRSDDDTGEFWSPFTSQTAWEVGDGRVVVEVRGYERGHEPGRTAEFTVTIENRREVEAELEVCTKLINESEIVQRFDKVEIALEPEESDSMTFDVTLDEELEPRAYGFAVVVGDIGSLIHTIRVGIPDDEADSWLDADELVCD
jgi:hypothetical protein